MQHDFFDFFGDDEDSAIAGDLTLIRLCLGRAGLSLVLLVRVFLILIFLIMGWGLRALVLSRLPLRLLTRSRWSLRGLLIRCAWRLSQDPGRYGGQKKENQ